MRKLYLATTAALLLLAAPAINFAQQQQQSQPQLFADIERVLREKEPQWKTERASVRTDPPGLDIVLRAGKQQAAIGIKLWAREKDAHDVFVAYATTMSNTRKGSRRSRLPNLGVENYIWTNPGSAAWPTIHFRQSRALVTVFAPSVTVAKRFARHILAQINAGQD